MFVLGLTQTGRLDAALRAAGGMGLPSPASGRGVGERELEMAANNPKARPARGAGAP